MSEMARVERRLEKAERFRIAGKAGLECGAVRGAFEDLLAAGVRRSTSVSSCVALLQEYRAADLLARICEFSEFDFEQVDSGKLSLRSAADSYMQLVYAHAALLMEDGALAERFLNLANRSDVLGDASPAMKFYSSAFLGCVRGTPTYEDSPRLRGVERHWSLYGLLLARGSRDPEVEAMICDSFANRNTSGADRDDPYRIDGSKSNPALVDFRLGSTLFLYSS